MLLCGRIVLVAWFLAVFHPQIWERKDYAGEVHTCDLIPKVVCSSVNSAGILAALCPGIRNTNVSTSSKRLPTLFPLHGRHPSAPRGDHLSTRPHLFIRATRFPQHLFSATTEYDGPVTQSTATPKPGCAFGRAGAR